VGAVTLGCGPVEAELPDVEITHHDISVPGLPLERVAGEPVITVPWVQRLSPVRIDRDAFQSVLVRAVIITPKAGVDDLGFIRSLRLTVAPQSGGGAPVEIARYVRGVDVEDDGPDLRLVTDPPAEVLESWRANAAVITLEVSGTLPPERWTVDVGFRVAARLHYGD
jgi:hypothetical protein